MDTTFDKSAWAAKKQAARQEAYGKIEQYLDGLLMEDGRFSQYLTVQGRFPQCSVGNAILIAAQKPEATYYRTYEDWSKENISIRRGEKSFSMLVPNGTYTGKDGRTHTNFDVQKVFDISQTNAVPKEPALDVRQSLQGVLLQVVDGLHVAVHVVAENLVVAEKGGHLLARHLVVIHGVELGIIMGRPTNSTRSICSCSVKTSITSEVTWLVSFHSTGSM